MMPNRWTLLLLSLCCTLSLLAQKPFNYEKAWQKIDSLIYKELPKSALAEVNKLYAQSVKDQQEAQRLKAIICKGHLSLVVEEESFKPVIVQLEKELKTAKQPSQQILHSLLADVYLRYFERQRWKIYDRKKTNSISSNPDTWSAENFHQRITQLYSASLKNPALLQQTNIDNYQPILIKGEKKLRPTLYDVLAHKFLDYLQSDEIDISEPIDAITLNDAASLSMPKLFIRHHYSSNDSSNRVWRAIQLYQQLLSFHLNDADPSALIDADLSRYAFVQRESSNPYKKRLGKEWLENMVVQYPDNEMAAMAAVELIEYWRDLGEAWEPQQSKNTEGKMALAIAANMAKDISGKFPKTIAGERAAYLYQTLTKPQLKVEVEQVNVLKEPFRAKLSFTNTTKAYLRIIKAKNGEEVDEYFYPNEDWWSKIVKQTSIRQWTQDLPAYTDLREHSAEIAVGELPVGEYWLLASADESFSTAQNALTAVHLYVSNISYVYNSSQHLFVLDRVTGKPLVNAQVQFWKKNYDYEKRKQQKTFWQMLRTDKNGLVMIPKDKSNSNRNLLIEITHGNDHLFVQNEVYNTGYVYDEEQQQLKKDALARYFFFTDRGLYRPGQTVYFKAIGVSEDNTTGNAILYLPNKYVLVNLFDANQHLIKSLKLMHNEFGSIQGSFILPANGLTGSFRIEVQEGDERHPAYFKVEEYKRPKFSASFSPVQGSYRLHDSVTVKGNATAFAGNSISGASVKYTVRRSHRFPIWDAPFKNSWTAYPPLSRYSGQTAEIANGTVTTQTDGSFSISFPALPDEKIDAAAQPIFTYSIEASVTDINGETHDANTTVSVGYTSLQLSLDNARQDFMRVDSAVRFVLSSSNLNNEPVPTNVQWKVVALQTSNRLLRNRYWSAPDTSTLDKASFVQRFPHDPYLNEDEMRSWPLGKQLLGDTVNTGSNNCIQIPAGSLPAGMYALQFSTTDKDGQAVSGQHIFGMYDVQMQRLPMPMYQLLPQTNLTLEPGEKANILQGSTAKPAYVIELTSKFRNQQQTDSLTYHNMLQPMLQQTVTATEADRGGYHINRVFVQHNRVYSNSWQVNVPWSNKELHISLASFRNKLLPGQQETWTLNINGKGKEKAAAELLASMYDASLDDIQPFAWSDMYLWPNHYFAANGWQTDAQFKSQTGSEKYNEVVDTSGAYFYTQMMTIAEHWQVFGEKDILMSGFISTTRIATMNQEGVSDSGLVRSPAPHPHYKLQSVKFTPPKIVKDEEVQQNEKPSGQNGKPVQIRKNFNETAFWLPQLRTDTAGNVSLSFTMPEALTQWKLQLLAHNQQLQTGLQQAMVVTQKELMVQPNAPRFFRQGDQLELVSKVVNLSNKELTGVARLELFNASTNQPVDGWLQNVFPQQYFTVAAGQSVAVKFPLQIPVQYTDALTYRITATADNYSDGEEMTLPVLSNRVLVTETLPLTIRNTNQRSWQWQKLLQSDSSSTLQHQSFSIEFTSNPVWLAVQSLPYLTEYPYECAEQTWNRFYANALAAHISKQIPNMAKLLQQWQQQDTAALLSNLQKNEALKTILLEETPWVLAAKTEAEQKKQLAVLFDVVRMANEWNKALQQMEELQSSNGGFVWFKGGADDRYITQYIVSSIGHLLKLNAAPTGLQNRLQTMATKAIAYLDARMQEDYQYLLRTKSLAATITANDLQVQYFYARSFFPNALPKPAYKTAYDFYFGKLKNSSTKRSKQTQAMLAMVLQRNKQTAAAAAILKSLTENSITHPEMGMYWKEFNNPAYYWWQAPIESHALLIEAYAEIENNATRIADLKTWLLRQKQTNNWKTTKATADACYALLLKGNNWAAAQATVQIAAGNWTPTIQQEAGTGYVQVQAVGEKVKAEMGNISIQLKQQDKTAAKGLTAWGAAYWQYFENLDQITEAATGLQLQKKLYKEVLSNKGVELVEVLQDTPLKPGDKLVVRLTITSDRSLEYVHLKDMRAACLEPVSQLSQYQWQGALGYYQAPKDASMNFFIHYLPKGTYTLDYSVWVTHEGTFNNGISTIQCMYAPEFSSHTSGQILTVKAE
ncbi:MAG: alpha-2-macroglobulin [Chitinophagaceae bacterium]|nr:alpha-2-macroglobulin [Chitinophagaceae bacterium]